MPLRALRHLEKDKEDKSPQCRVFKSNLTVQDVSERYGLKLLSIDFTDITLIARIGFFLADVYADLCKHQKIN